MNRGDCTAGLAVFAWALREGLMDAEDHASLAASCKKSAWRLSRCDGKDPFDTFGLADRVANKARNRDRGCYAYGCPVCHKFHVGTHGTEFGRRKKFFKQRGREEALEDA